MKKSSNRFLQLLENEKLRFIFGGGANTLIGFLLFSFIYWTVGARLGYVITVIVAYFCSSILAFAIYRLFVFRVEGQILLDYMRFVVVYIPSIVMNAVALPICVNALNVNPYLAQAVLMIVLAILSYLGHKFFSFSRRKKPERDREESS